MARMGDRRDEYGVMVWRLKERDRLEDLGIDGNIMLKWIFRMDGEA